MTTITVNGHTFRFEFHGWYDDGRPRAEQEAMPWVAYRDGVVIATASTAEELQDIPEWFADIAEDEGWDNALIGLALLLSLYYGVEHGTR